MLFLVEKFGLSLFCVPHYLLLPKICHAVPPLHFSTSWCMSRFPSASFIERKYTLLMAAALAQSLRCMFIKPLYDMLKACDLSAAFRIHITTITNTNSENYTSIDQRQRLCHGRLKRTRRTMREEQKMASIMFP